MIRIILTLFILLGGGAAIGGFFDDVNTLIVGKMAGNQFISSDSAYLATHAVNSLSGIMSSFGPLIVLGLLLLIWYKPIKRVFAATAGAALLLFATMNGDARAYYQQTDYAEPYFVLPNESAFFVPDVGDNKSSQATFGSEQYLLEKKIPAKRFEIPHAKLSNSSIFSNYYVPAGRLIIVDRAPTSRIWVKGVHRGTSTKDESFPCQSSEGLDITVGIAIGAEVYEENAAKFLYHFGVNPPEGDRTKPEVIFTSVYQGKSLHEVMDGAVRSRIQSLVCDEMTKRSLDDNNKQAAAVMATVQQKVGAYMDSVGITLDFIGWADTFDFADSVQAAINRNYEATQDLNIAKTLAPHTTTLQALAVAEGIRTMAHKWTGALPTSVSLWWLPTSVSDAIAKVTTMVAPPPAADKKQ